MVETSLNAARSIGMGECKLKEVRDCQMYTHLFIHEVWALNSTLFEDVLLVLYSLSTSWNLIVDIWTSAKN